MNFFFNKKTSAIFTTAFFLVIIVIAFTTGAVIAAPNKSNLNDILGNEFGGKWIPDMVGATCGIPGKNATNKCCNIKKAKKLLDDEPVNLAHAMPEFFCLPPGLGEAVSVGGGILGDFMDTFTKPLEAGLKLVTGDVEGAAGALKDAVLPEKVFNGISDAIDGNKICLSDAPKKVVGTVVGILPTRRIAALDLPEQQCLEGAVPKTSNGKCTCVRDKIGLGALCRDYVRNAKENQACMQCAGKAGVWTGIGCVRTDLPGFVSSVLGIGIGIAGGFAFLCMLYAAVLFQTSRGNPERLKKAREYLTSCITGLILIIFAVFIMRIIGVNLLGIPGFN